MRCTAGARHTAGSLWCGLMGSHSQQQQRQQWRQQQQQRVLLLLGP